MGCYIHLHVISVISYPQDPDSWPLTPTLNHHGICHQAASREAHIGGSFYGWNGGIEGHETRQVGSTQAQAWRNSTGEAPAIPAPWKYVDVSENSGFSPQIIHFNRVFHYKPSILGYPYFWKHLYDEYWRICIMNFTSQSSSSPASSTAG